MSDTATPTKPPRGLGDRIFGGLALSAGITILLALAGVFLFLFVEGYPGLSVDEHFYRPFTTFWGYVWPLIFGTTLAAILALLISVPFAIGIALFVSHYAPKALRTPVAYVMDLLAAVPSVVFGLWGGGILAKQITGFQGWLHDTLGFLPFFAGPPSATGRTMLNAGIVLAIMILPITAALCREVFAQTPRLHEEAALALGATRWEMIRLAVFPYARSGMVSAIMLGLGRALGETMAVAMVLSAAPVVTLNLISSSNPATIASNIATNYKEATPDKQAVLIATGLVLFAFTFAVNFLARWIAGRGERKQAK
ncbi:MAG: phosphate ABC transporter permease subunit PstC [Nocardioides sp.]